LEGNTYASILFWTGVSLGNLWIGTNGGGLIYYNRATGTFKQYKHNPGDPASLSSDVIVTLCLDSDQKLWIGTYFGGLNCFDGKRFNRYRHDPSNPKSLSTDNVWEVFEDASKRLWVGTLGGGIYLFDKSTATFVQFSKNKPDAFRSENIKEINEDIHGNLWVGGDDGVSILNIRTGLFHTYHANDKTRPGLNNNRVTAILRDKKGRMWVGTMKGIHLYLESKSAFKIIKKDDGLPEDAIIALVEDNLGNIWATTPAGVLKIEIVWKGDENFSFTVRKYDELNGIQGHTFNENAVCKLSTGELVFGGASGFNIIDPGKIASKSRPAKLILTGLQIMDQEVMPGKKLENQAILMHTLNEQEQIVLEHKMNFFSIAFSELNFFHPEKSRYFYKLSGFSEQWFEADKNSRKVAYTNLDPGKYTFYLKAINEDGTQINARPLQITIRPPFWLSNTAYLIYLILIAGALLLARWLLLDRERMRFKIEQERIENQRVHELDLLKIKFITHLSKIK
jgi:sugar lactone lactonase YvrE